MENGFPDQSHFIFFLPMLFSTLFERRYYSSKRDPVAHRWKKATFFWSSPLSNVSDMGLK